MKHGVMEVAVCAIIALALVIIIVALVGML